MIKKTKNLESNYSIDEILSAVDEIQNIKKENIENNKNISIQKDFTSVPKDTLKLIEEAEKNKY
jgi:hypothetical protein